MKEVTGEQVKDAMIKGNITHVDHHECGICNHMVYYFRSGNNLYFDPSCGCVSGGGAEQREWFEAAEWINMQSVEEIRDKIKVKFGMT